MRIERVTNAANVLRARKSERLRLFRSERTDEEIALPAAGVTLGADASCDVVVDDLEVSGKHATIVPRENGFEVSDLGSRNGTWVDGNRIHRAIVAPGAVVRIGRSFVQMLPAEQSFAIAPSRATSFGAMLGASDAMRQVFAVLERASATNTTILLLGESGTGKELAARAVHEASPRRDRPFIVFDCGAASDTLIESTLFGHKRGAFTGAHADHPGAFALAHGGTLFLDEIGDLPIALQPKLLRMLETGEVWPLGARKAETFDVRVVAATHRDLEREVLAGSFRADLFYRLAVIEVHLPALRQRSSDIAALVSAMLRSHGAPAAEVAGRNLDSLLGYAWPGNVRELRNVIARAVTLAPPGSRFSELPILLRGSTLALDAGPFGRADVPYHEAKDALLTRFDRQYCTDLLRRAGGNVAQGARLAGVERKHLYKILERAGLRGDSDDSSSETVV